MTGSAHGFVVGRRYRNNVRSYEVLFIHFPLMEVRYDQGHLATLSVPIQERIQERLQAHESPVATTSTYQQDVPLTANSHRLLGGSLWWVNQGSSYDQERRQSILAAPVHGIDGRTIQHHETMRELLPGDRVLHYVRKELLAIGNVTAPTEVGVARPDLHAGRYDQVYIGHVAYTPIVRAIHINEIPAAWRIAEGGPFDKNGNPKFGYLYPLSMQFVQQVTGRFADRVGGI